MFKQRTYIIVQHDSEFSKTASADFRHHQTLALSLHKHGSYTYHMVPWAEILETKTPKPRIKHMIIFIPFIYIYICMCVCVCYIRFRIFSSPGISPGPGSSCAVKTRIKPSDLRLGQIVFGSRIGIGGVRRTGVGGRRGDEYIFFRRIQQFPRSIYHCPKRSVDR